MKTLSILVLLFCWCLLGCGGGETARKTHAVGATPESYYDQGKTYLRHANFKQALLSFRNAIDLDPEFAPAYEGLARIYLELDKLDKAWAFASKAIRYDKDWILTRVVQAKVRARQEHYDQAIAVAKIAVRNVKYSSVPNKDMALAEVYMALGDIYRQAGQLEEAQEAFLKVLSLDPLFLASDQAMRDLKQRRSNRESERLATLRKVAEKSELTRSDIAVLLVAELPLQRFFQPKVIASAGNVPSTLPGTPDKLHVSNQWPKDVTNSHWARHFIREALEYGALDNMPDGNFYPDRKMSRGDFAILLEDLMARYWDDKSMKQKYAGESSPYSDIANTDPYFNSVMVVTDRKLMSVFDDDSFKPLAHVSGTLALEAIRRLKSNW